MNEQRIALRIGKKKIMKLIGEIYPLKYCLKLRLQKFMYNKCSYNDTYVLRTSFITPL